MRNSNVTEFLSLAKEFYVCARVELSASDSTFCNCLILTSIKLKSFVLKFKKNKSMWHNLQTKSKKRDSKTIF